MMIGTEHTRFGQLGLAVALTILGCQARTNLDQTTTPLAFEPSVAAVASHDTERRPPSDLDIALAVIRHLASDGLSPNSLVEVEVEVVQGIAALTGEVDNLLAKNRATEIAEAVRGVRAVSNQIVVAAAPVADLQLAADVSTALLFDAATDSHEIEVIAHDGRVILTGAVNSWAESRLAEQVVASVRGVEDIDNELRIVYVRDRDDAEIAREIEAVLRSDVLIDARTIDVLVEDGRVVLTGTVGTAAERTLVSSQVWTAGVREVDVEGLEVDWVWDDPDLRDSHLEQLSPDAIARAIEDAAMYDPRVSCFDFDPIVYGTSVRLEGRVATLEARRAAEQIARDTVGVTHVQNEIVVAPMRDISDLELTAAIGSNLQTRLSTELREIGVEVREGVVTLTGVVDSNAEKVAAFNVAAETGGVVLVDDRLQVVDPELGVYSDPTVRGFAPHVEYWDVGARRRANPSDEEILAAIADEMFWSAQIDDRRIHVFVEGGQAVLTGTVKSARERALASISAYQGGAQEVENLLAIEGS